MKKIMLLTLTLLPVLTWAQKFNYTLIGKIGGVLPDTKIYLAYESAGSAVYDSTMVSKGSFLFKGKLSEPLKAMLILDRRNIGLNSLGNDSAIDMTTIYLEHGNIYITAKDSIKNANIVGKDANVDNEKLKKGIALPERNIQRIIANCNAATKGAKVNKDSLYNVTNELIEKEEANKRALMLKFIRQNPNSYVSLVSLREVAGRSFEPSEIEPLFQKLSANSRNSPAGLRMAESITIMKSTAIGATAPLFTINDVNGQPVSLKDFRGQYVLLDFWASWCKPCREENPYVVKAYERFKDKHFCVLGISLDEPGTREQWLAAIKADKLTYKQVSELQFWNSKVGRQYGVVSIPQNFLIDPNGKIIAKNLRGEDLINKLNTLFN